VDNVKRRLRSSLEAAEAGCRDDLVNTLPGNKYPTYFAPQPAMMTGDWKEAKTLVEEAVQLLPEEPLIVSLRVVFYALTGEDGKALDCLTKACASPKSFGHTHHSYYQFACILGLLGRREAAFEVLLGSLQAKYPDHLGLL